MVYGCLASLSHVSRKVGVNDAKLTVQTLFAIAMIPLQLPSVYDTYVGAPLDILYIGAPRIYVRWIEHLLVPWV